MECPSCSRRFEATPGELITCTCGYEGGRAPDASGTVPTEMSILAVASLVMGVLGLVPLLPVSWLMPTGAIIAGVFALQQIQKEGYTGHGMAVAGIVLGVLALVVYVLLGALLWPFWF